MDLPIIIFGKIMVIFTAKNRYNCGFGVLLLYLKSNIPFPIEALIHAYFNFTYFSNILELI